MLGNRPVGGKGAFDNRTQMVGVEMFYWRIAPSQRVGRFDLHPKEAFNQPDILPLRCFVKVQPFHSPFKSPRCMTERLWQRPTG
ncbi:hypothetical protein X751_08200 [Mesorhizobium sp. LNJC395A00]|nr:hypothetical protein X751_08200 [Mesorhizobium sp. LNJC395A00]